MFNDSKSKNLKNDILAFMKQSANGVSAEQIHAHLNIQASKRKIQRSLTELFEEKMIYRLGKGPATFYQTLQKDRVFSSLAEELPLSIAGKKVMDVVSQPLLARMPVSYHREMLDNYIPNKTEYLDQSTRMLLYQMGKTSDQTRPAGTYGREILNRLLIDLSWASSKLEGNTYSRLDTQRLIEYGYSVEGKDAIETQMILNHKDAIRFLIEDIDQIFINKHTILNLHGLLSDDLLANPEDSGRIRTKIVDISGTTYKPLAIPQIIEECFNVLLEKASKITDPFEQAFFFMVHFPYLQPFIDLNKRVSRLSANIPLLKNNLCPLTFIGMPETAYIQGTLGIYELNDISLLRDVFILAYERSAQEYLAVHQSLVEPDPARLKNREHIQKLIHLIVKICHKEAHLTIAEYSESHIDESDRALFKQLVEKELERLHEGVLVRYRLSLSDFEKWTAQSKT